MNFYDICIEKENILRFVLGFYKDKYNYSFK